MSGLPPSTAPRRSSRRRRPGRRPRRSRGRTSLRIFLPCSTLVPSSRTTSGTFRPSSLTAATTPSAMMSQRMMPPKMLTRMAFTFGSDSDDLEGRRHLLLGGAAADVEEVGGLAAVELDDVHRRHGQAGAVDHAADVAVELDVVEVVLRWPRSPSGPPRSSSRSATMSGWRKARCRRSSSWRRARMSSPSLGDDQRVDLEQQQSFSTKAL